jgi:tetratricopeptide (TPR) repeat protein
MRLLKYLLFLLILFSFNQLKAEDRKNQLNKLFNELKINNADLVYDTEQKIWEIWSTHPTDQFLTTRLAEGSKLVRNKQLVNAVNIFTEVIEKDPTWAEAWNKRATVLYMLGDYQSSQNDIDKVLKLEDRHFGALAGQGLVNIKLENYEKAIKSYEKAQEIYPAMQSPKIMIEQIEQLIKQQLI